MPELLTAPLPPTEEQIPSVAPYLDAESNGMLMTPEEFDAVQDYDDTWSYELINGVVVVSPISSEGEADPVEELGRWLRNYQEYHPQGRALDRILYERYVATPMSRRKADRVIWAGLGRMPVPESDVPTIAVEFVSLGKRNRKRDYVTKRREYMSIGIKEYWIVDRFSRQMTIVKVVDGQEQEVIINEAAIYTTPLLPGFELPLAKLLAIADMWAKPKGSDPA